jgi:hypothetical protein
MADAVTTQVLYESKGTYVVKFTNISDGTGESAVTKIDPAALTPTCAEVDITKMIYSTDGMSVRILWDASSDVLAWVIPQNQWGEIDFGCDRPGFLRNNAGSGKTGVVQFTTFNHSSGDSYSIVLHCRKRQTAEV